MFGNKIKRNPNIALVNNNHLIPDEKSLAETFNDYFGNVVSNPGINFLDLCLVKVMFLIMIITRA